MTQQSGNLTKLEWVTCPHCSTTFQVAVPAKAADMRVWEKEPWTKYTIYSLSVCCIHPQCLKKFWVETDLPTSM